MTYSHFERLSALDDSFLELENGRSHMLAQPSGTQSCGMSPKSLGDVSSKCRRSGRGSYSEP